MGMGDVLNEFWSEELKKNPDMIILDPKAEKIYFDKLESPKNEAGACYGTLGGGMSFYNKMIIANAMSEDRNVII